MKSALITGITGQDGSYLAEFLLEKGYKVHGIIRRASTNNLSRLDNCIDNPNLVLHYGDLADGTNLCRIISEAAPDEVYNLAAQSHVRISFNAPEYTGDVVGTGALRLLEALRQFIDNTGKASKYYQAGSSEMFGAAKPPQSESTPFHPRSPYAVGKMAAHWYGINYRESYGMFVCNGILFNHESPRRGENFVTRKITKAASRIKLGLQKELYLGNLDAKRDWGFSGDYVKAMWMMLQHDIPGDYVVATGEAYSVRDFLAATFSYLDLNWEDYVKIDPRFYRPAEVDYLLGDSTHIQKTLGWEPEVSFEELVHMMVDHDMLLANREKVLLSAGEV